MEDVATWSSRAQVRAVVSPLGIQPSLALVHSVLFCQTVPSKRLSICVVITPPGSIGAGTVVARGVMGRCVSVTATLLSDGVPVTAMTLS